MQFPPFKAPLSLLASCFLLLALGATLPLLSHAATESASLPASPAQPIPTKGNSVSQSKSVQVTTRREGDFIRFYVENRELCEVTMTFDMALSNLNSGVRFPHTAVFPAGQVTEAFQLTSEYEAFKWSYSFTNNFKLGSRDARHDDCAYELPYEPGERFKVTQAANGTYSHKGSNKYAIDWKMPEGTLVYAARGGLVVKTKSDSDMGGPSMDYNCYNNYVLIRHSDGTLGHYCHLEKGGCLVAPGQLVEAGQPIGRSGNTGFSSGPHLHFCVFLTRSGTVRDSVPIKFRTSEGKSEDLVCGRSYRCPNSSGSEKAGPAHSATSPVAALSTAQAGKGRSE